MIGQSIRRLIPADRQAEEDMILARLAQSECIQNFETVGLAKIRRLLAPNSAGLSTVLMQNNAIRRSKSSSECEGVHIRGTCART
jgi:hypothetical protein